MAITNLKNELNCFLESPFAQIKCEQEIYRLTKPISLVEETLCQTVQMEIPSRAAVEMERIWNQRCEIEAGCRVATDVEKMLHRRDEIDSLSRATLGSAAALQQMDATRNLYFSADDCFSKPLSLMLPPRWTFQTFKDRIEALEREVDELKSKLNPPPPPPNNGDNHEPGGQYL